MANANQKFTLFPAIDVLNGKCVRLLRGDYSASTEYGQHPRRMAERWLDEGARFLHVVDLNGAKSGVPDNLPAIAGVVEAATAAGAQVQVGGGIRSLDTLDRWLSQGVTRCVVGTAALDRVWVEAAVRRFGPEALVIGLDGRGGMLAVNGWTEQTDVRLVDVARDLAELGVRHALVTDVDKDGTMQGPNLPLAQSIAGQGLAAIASGGVRNLADVLAAKLAGLAGAIAGRAIYDGQLSVREALAALATAVDAADRPSGGVGGNRADATDSAADRNLNRTPGLSPDRTPNRTEGDNGRGGGGSC